MEPGTGFTVDFQQVTDAPPGVGLSAGSDFNVTLSLKVPEDYPPGLSDEITNRADATASNAQPVSSTATIRVDSPVAIDVQVDKSWQPGTQAFDPGAASTIGLDARNTSNVAVDVVSLQEPKDAPDAATSLDPSNPFLLTDFTGFGAVALPSGCTSVQVDAYTKSGGSWSWTPGAPQDPPTLALPAGVGNTDVGGIRITCSGTIAPGASLRVDLDLSLRSTDRNDGTDLSTQQHMVSNVTTGSVEGQGQRATDEGTASYTVTPLIPTVQASKNITPERLTAGQPATATIGATNGDTPVTSLHIEDLGFFTDEITFGGFTGPLTWPSNATGAELVYQPLDPNDPLETIQLSRLDGTPSSPVNPISGFEITWTGPIEPNETGGAGFTIQTTEVATGGVDELTVTNTVDVEVTAANGLTDTDSASHPLTIVDPRIDVTLDKTVRPSSAVEPGETVISSLVTNATSTGDGAVVDTITVEDTWALGVRCPQFWNAFDLSAIAATQVPADTTLTIEVRRPAGTWVVMGTYGPLASATVYQRTAGQVAGDLSVVSLTPQQVEGIRFTFSNPLPGAFPADTTVTPNVVFAARGAVRDTINCTAPTPDIPVAYTNTATATVEGETDGGRQLLETSTDTGQGTVIISQPGGPGPGISIDKDWDRLTVASQSDQQASTRLTWSVAAGLTPVQILDTAADPATTPVRDTVFDAFDLMAVQPIAASNEPYTNGWWLKYDTVTEVALFNGTAPTPTWVTVPAPGGTWMVGNRGFKGYTLTTGERASTIAVRITLAETGADTTARQAALTAPGAGFDPFAPQPGSGVGSGSTDRFFDLTWQVRDRARSDGRFVVEDELFNTGATGVVDNSVALEGTTVAGGGLVRDTADDTIQILDPPPLVSVTKTVTPTSNIYTPPVGTPVAQYPTATWTITGKNGSVAKASYVRLTDPATCTDVTLAQCESDGTPAGAVANPFDTSGTIDYLADPATPNPFERFDATKVTIAASIPAEVDLTNTTVWLLRWSAGTYILEQTTASAVNALTQLQLADVVGFSVTFQGAQSRSVRGHDHPGQQPDGDRPVAAAPHAAQHGRRPGPAGRPDQGRHQPGLRPVLRPGDEPRDQDRRRR